ncbi:hypothetical protein JHK82_053303 [Glycine max]|nr:hypothetical protein JHK84_053171 [Glycine max]KAG5085906.1 hypothetical protein JHK82_053303 [Glycine max]
MESHLLVGPISAARYGCAANSSHFHSAASSTWANSPRRRSPLVMASSSSAAVNGGQNYYAVLGVARTATTVQIKRAYRLLARKASLCFSLLLSLSFHYSIGSPLHSSFHHGIISTTNSTTNSLGDAIGVADPARFSRQHTRLATVAPVEEEEKEEHIFDDEKQDTGKTLEFEIVILFKESLYHPDVSKDPHAAELFKSIHHAYEVLSNEATRVQYDQELQFGHKPYREKWSYSTEFEDQARFYRWDRMRKKMDRERYWENYNVNEDYYTSETDEEEDEVVDLDEERGSFVEVLRSAFMSLFLLQTLGSRFSLTFSSLMALFDKKLDTGYKMGYVIAWILGGRGGILLTLCLSFASWVCGKTSSSVVALVVVALWVGSYLARYAPLPQGALLALLYMSIKLQSDLI